MDKIKFVENYEAVDDWCRNATVKLRNAELLDYNYNHFTIACDNICIFTESYHWGEYSNDYYALPVDIFYNDCLDEYIEKKLAEKKKREEGEQKKTFEEDRKYAIEKIKELKKKFNI